MKKRILSCILSGIMVVGLLSGCGSTGSGSTETGSTNKPASSTQVEVSNSSSDDNAPITFTYYNADGKNSSWDNPVAKAITEATGVTLEVSYPVSSQGEPKEDVALMIASDEFPDMIYAKGSATDLYEAGAYIDMTDLIEQYGPNIKKMYGDELEKLKWGEGDDGIYQLSYAGVGEKDLTTDGTAQIQWAVIKENNYEYPTTLDEFEKTIKDYLAKHPKTPDGQDMIGITMSASGWLGLWRRSASA